VEVDGDADAGFGPVADAFARNFEARGEIGAAVAVYTAGVWWSTSPRAWLRSATGRSRARRS